MGNTFHRKAARTGCSERPFPLVKMRCLGGQLRAVKGVSLLDAAQLPLTARTARVQCDLRKRPLRSIVEKVLPMCLVCTRRTGGLRGRPRGHPGWEPAPQFSRGYKADQIKQRKSNRDVYHLYAENISTGFLVSPEWDSDSDSFVL